MTAVAAALAAKQLDDENPWPGLESFDENACAFFHGRDAEAASMLRHVLDAPVTVLYGRSGLGKTSLLRAGLFPLLRDRHFLPIYVRLDLKPDAAPLSNQLRQSVRNSIRADLPDAMLPSDDESLWEYLHRTDFELWSAQNYPLTPVIVLDQFEELFTLGERVPDLVQAFQHDLGDLAENRIPADLAARIEDDEAIADRFQLRSHNYKLLISLREDFLPDLEGWRQLIPALGRSRVRLLRLGTEPAFDAVHKPAAHLMTDALARRVVGIIAGEDVHRGGTAAGDDGSAGDHLGAAEVEPALLSLFCRELNEERKRRGQPRFDEQLVEDAKRDILSNYYSSCVSDLPPRVADFIESELITEKGFRNSYAREDAVPSRLTDDELTRLIGSRLLRLEERYGAQRIELTHDVLTGIVRDHRDIRRADDQRAALAAGVEQERQAAAQREAELDHERNVERQRRLDSERAGRRLKWLSAVLAIVCVAAIASTGYAVTARKAANDRLRDATAQRLYGESQLMLAGLQPGGSDDVLGIQELLAALVIPSRYRGEKYRLLAALNQERDLLKVIDVPEMVGSVAFSPDGTKIVSGSTDKTVRLWDAATGRPVGDPMRGHDGWVTSVAFSPDGSKIASGALDNTVRLWDAASGRAIGQPMTGFSVAFSPDGTRIASGGVDGTVRLWDAATGRSIGEPLRGHDLTVVSMAFSPDGTRIASGSYDKTVRLWDVETGRSIGEPMRHSEIVASVAFSPDGTRIASGSSDKTVQLWDAATGRPIGEPMRHSGAVTSVAFSPDGTRIASGGADKTVRLWDAASQRPIGEPLRHSNVVESVAFSPDSLRLASGGDDKTVRVWDASSWQPLIGHDDGVGDTNFSGDGRRITSGSKDKTVRTWDAVTGRPIGPPLRIDDDDVDRLYPFGEDRLLSVGPDRTPIRMWDARSGKAIGAPVRLHPDLVGLRSIAWDHKSRRIAATTDPFIVQVWNADTMRPTGEPITNDGLVMAIGLSADGRILATGDSGGTIRLWDSDSGKPIGRPMTGEGYVVSIAFSSDGQLIAAGGLSGSANTLRLWDTRTSQPVGDPMPVDSAMIAATFSPDGRILASGSGDGTIRLWNVADRTPLGPPLVGHTAAVLNLEFSPDGTKFVSASDDHTLRVWPTPPLSPSSDALCDKITHNMSRAQWNDKVSREIDYIRACPNLPEADDAG